MSPVGVFVFPIDTLMRTCVHTHALHDGLEPLQNPREKLVTEFSQDSTWLVWRTGRGPGGWCMDWTVCGEDRPVSARAVDGTLGQW